MIFALKTSKDPETGLYTGSVNVEYASFWAFDLDSRKLNGIWIDFAMVCTVTIYLSICNFWVIFRSVKVVMSDTTTQKLKRYALIESEITGNKVKSIKQTRKEVEL